MEFDNALLKAMVLHSALNLYGLAYMQDSSTPYAEFSKRRTVVDFLQFPNQTLEYKGGDCDDLSILYSALLESLGIETAFITIPGHIFIAFRLSSDEKRIRSNFRNSTDFIIREDGVLVPVEFSSMQPPIILPADNLVLLGFEEELDRLIKREAEPRISELKTRISASPNELKLQNTDQALAYYERLKEISPQLAEQVSNIEKAKASSGRSGDIGEEQGAVLWEE